MTGLRGRSRPRLARLATLTAIVAGIVTGCGDATSPPVDADQIRLSLVEPQAVSPEEVAALGEAFDRVDRYSVRIVDAVTLELIADAEISITSGGALHTLDIAVPESAFGRSVRITLIAYDGQIELYRSTTTVTLDSQVRQLPMELQIRYTGPGIRGVVTDLEGSPLGGVNVEVLQGQSAVALAVTEDDGTYLFVDLAPGTYAVVPVAPQGQSVCPVSRQLTIAGANDALLASFVAQPGTCEIEVLVLSGGDFDDTDAVATMLLGAPDMTVSTFFHVNALPTAEYLRDFDVVLLFMNGLFDESAALGTRLADYVAAGGNVVVASFYWQGRSDSGLGSAGWGGLEALDPFRSTGGARYQVGSLGSVTPHPLTAGVSLLVANSYWGGAATRAGTVLVASWSDGTPLVGYRVLAGGQRLVGVTLFPAIGTGATGNVATLFENAVTWAGAAGGPGL